MKKEFVFIISVLMIIVFLITGCDLMTSSAEPTPIPTPVVKMGVVAEANLVPADNVNLNFSIPGRVANILVEPGDLVNPGEVLARLGQKNTTALEAQIFTAQLAVLEAEQALEDLYAYAESTAAQAQINLTEARQALIEAEQAWDAIDTEDFIEELDDARVEMIAARNDLQEAEENLADHSDLSEDHVMRIQYEDELEEAKTTYNETVWAYETLKNHYDLTEAQWIVAQTALEDAQRKANATLDGRPDPDDLALAMANLEQAQGHLDAAKSAWDDVELTAPFAGEVMRIEFSEGTFTSPEQLGIILADTSVWYLETNDLTENQVIDIREGREVKIFFDAMPGETFSGEVESISTYFLERFGDITYVVRVRLSQEDPRLRWGMTAEIKFSD